jgi:hypothetical protein
MKKLAFALLTLATLAGCTDKIKSSMKNEKGSELEVKILTPKMRNITYHMNSMQDTAVTIYNQALNKTITYVNHSGNLTIVDEIKVINFNNFPATKWYTRGDEGTEEMFEDADKDYRLKVDFVLKDNETRRKEALESKIKDAREISYK